VWPHKAVRPTFSRQPNPEAVSLLIACSIAGPPSSHILDRAGCLRSRMAMISTSPLSLHARAGLAPEDASRAGVHLFVQLYDGQFPQGLNLRLQAKDSISGNYALMNAAGTKK